MHLAGEPVHLAGRLRPVHFTGKPPPWFSKVKVRLAFLSTQLRLKWDRATETKIRRLIEDHIPTHCPFMMSVNADASDSLHMEMLRHALDSGSMKWFERATQFGRRHASFPFLYDWDSLSTNLRKYVVYCVVNYNSSDLQPTLPLLPCPRLRYIDFVEWLPTAGVEAGWNSVRHYAGQLRTFSSVCGHGDITGADTAGHDVWQTNFAANIQTSKAPRGGDIPLRPWHLRGLAQVYDSESPFDKMMLATFSLLWFTALRAGHFSPKDLSDDACKHLMEWEHIDPYQSYALGVPRSAAHFLIPSMKQNQKERAKDFTTSTCCICEGMEGDEQERHDLKLLCPMCSLERWRRVAPDSPYVCCDCVTGKPFLRSRLTKELRRALDIALFYIDEADRKKIISLIAPKSFRSGAATAIVTATNAGFIAAAFLGHGNTQVTKQYYHKGDDGERLQLIGPLSNGLRNSGPAAAGRLVGSHAKWTRAGPLGSESVTLSDVRVSHA